MDKYLKYYESYSPWASFVFMKDSFLERSNIRKRALMNRQSDYRRLASDTRLLDLHRQMNACLVEAAREWQSHDYGEGYFYQGLAELAVSGLRDTDARIEAMKLRERVAGKTALEIGCNTGFLSIALAEVATKVTAFDINPHLVRIAELGASHLGRHNCTFLATSFENLELDERFDCVLSFANHSTYDGNTRQTVESYFEKCWERTHPQGRLLFESHPPAHEGKNLGKVIEIIERWFEVEEQQVLTYGTFLDRDRTFVVARRRERAIARS